MSIYVKDKHKILILLMWITVLPQASITMYLPSLPAIANQLHVLPDTLKMTISIYLLGFGISTLIYGPLSDRYGRKPVLLGGIFIAFIGYIINYFADSIYIFSIARLIQGVGCGSILLLGRAIIRDSFTGAKYSSASSYLTMGFAIGFGGGPVLGGYVVKYLGWRTDFIFLSLFSLLFFLLVWKILPETLLKQQKDNRFAKALHNIILNYKRAITNINLVKFLLGGVFAYSVIISYSVMTPFLIQSKIGISSVMYGWLTLLVSIPHYCASSYNRHLVLKIGVEKVFRIGTISIISSGIIMLVLHFLIPTNILSIILPIMVAVIGQSLIFSNTVSKALQDFPPNMIGTASAMFSSLQMLIISLISGIIAILPDKTSLAIALVLVTLGIVSSVILKFNVNKF